MEKKEEKKVCCICGKEYEGYGYNPFPVKEEGCCCQSCNYSVVVPERWERHKAFQRGEATGAGKVYISGAIAHYDMNERKEAFSRAEELLKTEGYDPVNPFNNGLPEEAHWKARTARKPVRRDHHDRFRTRQGFAQLSPGAGITVVFQHVHWAAMAEKQRGHSGTGHDDILRVSM